METTQNKVIEIGSRVTIKIGEKVKLITIVIPTKVDASIGCISFESPLGKALMGFQAGITVEYRNPLGEEISVEIIEIE